jgi:hypothetical protein
MLVIELKAACCRNDKVLRTIGAKNSFKLLLSVLFGQGVKRRVLFGNSGLVIVKPYYFERVISKH